MTRIAMLVPRGGDKGQVKTLRDLGRRLQRALPAHGFEVDLVETDVCGAADVFARAMDYALIHNLLGQDCLGYSVLTEVPVVSLADDLSTATYVDVYQSTLRDRENFRPWGNYWILEDGAEHKVKRIVVLPGQRLSYQRHRRRSEHWYVIRGVAVVTLDGRDVQVAAGEAVDIPVGTAHRVSNRAETPVELIEVQTGDYFGEDDIERLEDDYGRD